MAKRLFNLIILDESGSMYSIEEQAISGVNETIQTVKASQSKSPELQQFITLVTFNSDHVNEICSCQAADTVSLISEKDYAPSACTPLYDAMGRALTKIQTQVNEEDKVLVTIVTDGYENDSREYSGKAIKKLVSQLKKKDWVFHYIGANQNVDEVADQLDIDFATPFVASEEGTREMFKNLRSSQECIVSCCMDYDDDERISLTKSAEKFLRRKS